jgi:hypothetical protein
MKKNIKIIRFRMHLNFITKKASIEADNEGIFDKSEKIIRIHAGDFEKE